MRPKIPEHMVQQLDEETDKYIHSKEDRNMKLCEVGGFSSKGEFIRHAVRDKIEEHKEKYDIE
jgi:metal-responsive CopG/Arc/MetJ family transcriptional regulator